jgi:hypothetical protein
MQLFSRLFHDQNNSVRVLERATAWTFDINKNFRKASKIFPF